MRSEDTDGLDGVQAAAVADEAEAATLALLVAPDLEVDDGPGDLEDLAQLHLVHGVVELRPTDGHDGRHDGRHDERCDGR